MQQILFERETERLQEKIVKMWKLLGSAQAERRRIRRELFPLADPRALVEYLNFLMRFKKGKDEIESLIAERESLLKFLRTLVQGPAS